MAQLASLPVTVHARGALGLLVLVACVYFYMLSSPALPHDWLFAVSVAFGLLIFPGLWALAKVFVIDAEQLRVQRAFGLVAPLALPLADIREFRAYRNSQGAMTRFEIGAPGDRTLLLHMFQTNFEAGVAALRAARPDLPAQDMGPWSL